MKSAIILGGGVSGCAAARELSGLGFEVVLIEKESYLGGGCHTFFWGGHPYTEGPRPLHVVSDRIFNYINDIVPMRTFPVLLNTYIERDKAFYSFPIHWDDIQIMPDKDKILKELDNLPENKEADNIEDAWLNAVGPTLYEKYSKNYTKKMWEVESNRVFKDASLSFKGSPIQYGDRAVELIKGKKTQAYPIEETGYNRFFEYCVKDCEVLLNTEVKRVDMEKKEVHIPDGVIKYDVLVSTIAIDELMDYKYGELRYIGRDFIPIVLPVEHAFPPELHYVHYPNSERYLRIVEYKNITMHKSNDTLLVMELPSHNNKLYPYDISSEIEKSKRYLQDLPDSVFAIGRLGTYRYITIGECFEDAWELSEKLK